MADLIAEDTARAVAAYRTRNLATREPIPAQLEAGVSEPVLGAQYP